MDRSLRAVCAALALSGALAAAGCGGSSGKSAASGSSGGLSRTQAAGAFQACLAKHGVKLPAGFGGRPRPGAGPPPQGGQPGFSPGGKRAKAFAACRSVLPKGGAGGFPGGRRPQGNPAFAKYTSCLRKHGVTFGSANDQAAFKKASAACAKYAPTAAG